MDLRPTVSCINSTDSGDSAACSDQSLVITITTASVLGSFLVVALLLGLIQRIQDRRNPAVRIGGSQGMRSQRPADALLADGIDLHTLDAVSPTQIYGLKDSATTHEKEVFPRDSLSGDVCAICLTMWMDQDEFRRLKCGHVFHTNCIDPWFQQHHFDCPLCKCIYVVASREAVAEV